MPEKVFCTRTIAFDMNTELLKKELTDWSVEVFDQLPSTNQYIMSRAAEFSSPAVVVAETQTSGVGRGSNTWWSARGSLTFSVLVSPQKNGIPREEHSLLSLISAALVREAIMQIACIDASRLALKWPNDIYLDGRKVCGILLEQPGVPSDCLVIGIGINVNNSLANAPEEISEKAISLCDASSVTIDRTEMLISILKGFEQLLRSEEKRKELFPGSWNGAHFLDQRLITIDQSGKQLTGRCEGIDENGALIFRDMYGLHQIHSAVIVSWED